MLHPIDYRLSKNKFWLSSWNSYSLKNYKNLILNDKILNVLGYIFKNCFKVSYSFASPWSNPRKYRKYFSNFIIGFDGRRAIRTGPNKVKKLPGFIIPEDYNIIRFNNFSILKIYFLIDKNLETYWTKKQKNWRAPLKYFNMRYNKNKNSEDNLLKLNRNLVNSNIEKKNFKITSFFVYLINLLNNNSVKQHLYLNVSEQINFFKKDKKHLYFKFYYDNFKLLNKIRNNYFLFYLLEKNNNIILNKLGLVKNKKNLINKNLLTNIYFKNNNKLKVNVIKKGVKFLSAIDYNDLFKYKQSVNFKNTFKINKLHIYKNLLRGHASNLNNNIIDSSNITLAKKNFNKNLKAYILFNNVKYKYNSSNINLHNYAIKNIKLNLFTSFRKNIITKNYKKFYFNTNKKFGLGLFFQNSNFRTLGQFNKIKLNDQKFTDFMKNANFNKFIINLESYVLNNRFKDLYMRKNTKLILNKQDFKNYKYYLNFLKNKKKTKNDFILFKKIKNINRYKLSYIFKNLNTSYFFSNSQNFLSFLYLDKLNKKKNFISKHNKFNKITSFVILNSLYNSNVRFSYLSKNQKELLIKKIGYLNLITNKSLFNKKVIEKKNKNLLDKDTYIFNINRNNWGKSFLSLVNFRVKNNYLYTIKNSYDFNSKQISKKTLDKIKEYDSFLKINNFYNKGLNFNITKNFNNSNSILDGYKLKNLTKKISNSNIFSFTETNHYNTENIYKFKHSLNFESFYPYKDFQLSSLFNLSYKKTFSTSMKQQEFFTKDNLDKINYRLEHLSKMKFSRLKKFKPYSFKTISRNYRYKINKSILTSYIFNSIKKNYILSFSHSMENKKFLIFINKDTLYKAKNTILINNITKSNFNELKMIHYSFNSFNKKLKTLLFLKKKIQNKDSHVFLSKYKSKNFMSIYLNLVGLKNNYYNYLERLQFNYFKSQRNLKSKHTLSKNLFIKSYRSLLYTKSFYNFYSSFNYNTNFLLNFKNFSSKRVNYSSKKTNNIYKYKLNTYRYLNSNNLIELKQLYLPVKWNKNIMSIIPLTLKKNSLLNNNKFIYNKSNNLYINKYLKSRLSDLFWSKKDLNKFSKINKIKSENFNYRIYGLTKKLSDVKPLNKNDFKKIDILKPKTFLYWKHLKWFNLFIKNKFNFKFNSYYNSYSIFKLYENFKNLNFYHYKNYKQYNNQLNYNSFSSFKYNYDKLNNLTFYSNIIKSQNNFIYKTSPKNNDFLLSNWSHNIMFSSSSSKRLNYIPHLRFKPIKDSIFMWRLHLRKLNLLSKYYKARTKFYKNKLNFVSNYNTRANIINYLKVMESNFMRIKKSMQRELPLIHIKRYLLTQFKKLNSYIKVLLRRQKKRLNYEFKKQKLSFLKDNNKKLNSMVTSSKETEMLSKKLYSFVGKRFFLGKKNFIDYVKKFIEHLFLVIFKFDNLRLFYIKKYQINIMSTKAKLFKNLFNYRLATGFKIPFLVKVICKKLNFDKSLVGCKIGFFGRYSKKLRNRKIWKYVKHLKPSVISTPLDYYNILILQKWGITGIKLSILKKKTFNFIFNN